METKEMYLQKCLQELNKYDLNKDERYEFIEQIMEVGNMDDANENLANTLGRPQEFIDELFQLNGKSKQLKVQSGFNFKVLFIGLIILGIGLSILFDYSFGMILGNIIIVFTIGSFVKLSLSDQKKGVTKIFFCVSILFIGLIIGLNLAYGKLIQ